MRILFIILLFFVKSLAAQPVRVGIVGLDHDHVNWILGRPKSDDIEIVGIAEPNTELVTRLIKRYGFDSKIVFKSMEEMVEKTNPEAVLAFNSIFDHLKVVEYCAPKGIHVMVEKPMAVSWEHGQKMIKLARQHHIYLLTNYETTWYGSNKAAWRIVNEEHKIGDTRKIVFHTGHEGPKEIGCSKEFLQWLTDPVLNGGGALTDFGCYGANLATWLMKGEQPLTVFAVTQQIKPDIYPKVDDEATIVLTYPRTQVIIQASWNWPTGIKDMEVYGQYGYLFCKDRENMVLMEKNPKKGEPLKAEPLSDDHKDPFVYFANMIRGKIVMGANDLSGPVNNETVVKILEAARVSARTGKKVIWREYFR